MSKRVFTVGPGHVTGDYEFTATRPIHDGDIVTFKYPDGTSKRFVAQGHWKSRQCKECPFRNQRRPGGLILCGMHRVTGSGRRHRACELCSPDCNTHTMLQWFDMDNLMEEI